MGAVMTLNVIPPTMRARHADSGEWHNLYMDECGLRSEMPWDDYVHEDFVDEPYFVNIWDYDSFEATQ
jgi:hypothetical protein